MVLQVVNIPTATAPLLHVKQVCGVNRGGLICGDTGENNSVKVVQLAALADMWHAASVTQIYFSDCSQSDVVLSRKSDSSSLQFIVLSLHLSSVPPGLRSIALFLVLSRVWPCDMVNASTDLTVVFVLFCSVR